MPDYSYKALNNTGTQTQGTLTANSENEVMSMLDSQGLFPVHIARAGKASAGATSRLKVKARTMATFYSQLADLLHSGVPLLRSLEILERQPSQQSLSTVLRDVRAKVADGTSLAEAMVPYPRTFNELAVSMIRAGQEGGFLEDVLRRIADFTEHQEDLKSKVIGAMAYPVFLAVVGALVLCVLVMVFVPKFEPIFAKLREQGELPWITEAVIGTSHFLLGWWWLALGAIVGGWIAFKAYVATPDGRLVVDAVRLRVPVAGTIYLNLALCRFTRIQGTLLQNGIPLLQALKIAKDSTGNRVLTLAIEKAAENVTHGDSLAAPLEACAYFPRDVVAMVAVGEESNSLEKVLLDIANALEKRTARQLELFVRLLEPVMLLVMAFFTLIVVAGLLLPVFKMSMTVQ